MDWQTLAAAWGPAIPILLVLLKAHWDLVYKLLPAGFRRVRKQAEMLAGEAKERHEEHMELQKQILIELRALHSDLDRPTRKPRGRKRRAA